MSKRSDSYILTTTGSYVNDANRPDDNVVTTADSSVVAVRFFCFRRWKDGEPQYIGLNKMDFSRPI
jgi:hypothetical protein